MKIVFMGTPDFAVPSLRSLIDEFDVKAVFTQPDKPKGRGKKLSFSPVKEVALEHKLPIYQPIKLRTDAEAIQAIKDIGPDFIIVVAYGQILPKEVLDIPKFGCINLHASLLPRHRGAAPINWAIINGDKVTGNTTMLMDVGLDTGDMLLKNQVEIGNDMTYGELHDILMNSGSKLLVDTIRGVSEGKIIPEKQEGSLSTYAVLLNKEIAEIDWNKSALDIHNLIRGLNSRPTAYTYYKDEMMKIHSSSSLDKKVDKKPGTVLMVSKQGIEVATSEGVLLVKKVQFPNGKPLTVEQYINGNEIEEGTILGR